MADIKRTFTLKTIPNVSRNTITVAWALCISARVIRMAFVHFNRMSFSAFVNVWKRTYILRQNQGTKNVTRRLRKITVTKFATRNLWTPMFIIKRANVSSKFGRQQRNGIKIQSIVKYTKKSKVRRVGQTSKQFPLLILKQNCQM